MFSKRKKKQKERLAEIAAMEAEIKAFMGSSRGDSPRRVLKAMKRAKVEAATGRFKGMAEVMM